MHHKINWTNTLFLILTPLAAIAAVIYHLNFETWSWWTPVLFTLFYFCTGLSITAGYHRLFAHRTYKTIWPVKLFYLLFGAAAFQNSALKWSTDHRIHHNKVDTDEDPYNAKKGFWWSHIGWIFFQDDSKKEENWPKDLASDPLIMWQHNHIFKIGAVIGFLLPTIVSILLQDSWVIGFGIYGALRITFVHHGTFFINSWAHQFGSRPYTDQNTARDNALLALFTFGEGYHNFHHMFQADYRNGIEWYHFDPTKWLIKSMSKTGMASDLRLTPSKAIIRAKIKMEEIYAARHKLYKEECLEKLIEYRKAFLESYNRWIDLKTEYIQAKKQKLTQEKLREVKALIKEAKLEMRWRYTQWQNLMHFAAA